MEIEDFRSMEISWKVPEIVIVIRKYHREWKSEITVLETRVRKYHREWKSEITVLETRVRKSETTEISETMETWKEAETKIGSRGKI